ncbi:MAG: hypothetical protein HOL80_02450 [Candidatus Magasanikbacteria bacterium]|jgi:hypothetical protein|nr:hypothetical protein [Candidatus Magasanikbacteria bacterium]MBT5262736.1 hypothetical protein [Candidatus Magasanikbacteria bacterium]MBT5820589.1 hypothetical protein [Candidatus Magasanikbacteria bacterium]MBT6294228.1 hypothetical protein [Candidatus Magasanikbacteria bacterium]
MNGICFFCDEAKTVRQNRKIGELICSACYQREIKPKEVCTICECKEPAKTRNKQGGAICAACYQRDRRAKLRATLQASRSA